MISICLTIFQTVLEGMYVIKTISALPGHARIKNIARVINVVFMVNAKLLNAGRNNLKIDNTYSHVNNIMIADYLEKYHNRFYFQDR